MILNSFIQDAFYYFIPGILARGVSLLLLPLYTRILAPSDYGVLDLFVLFINFINLTVALEVSQGLARFYPDLKEDSEKKYYFSTAFWFSFVVYFFCGAFFFLNSEFFCIWGAQRPDLLAEFRIGMVYMFFNGIFYLLQNQLRIELRSRAFAFVSFLMTFVTAGVSAWLIVVESMGLQGILVGMLSGVTFGSLISLRLLRGSLVSGFSKEALGKMLLFSFPLVISGVAVWLNLYVDRLMINYYLSTDELGLYGIACRYASLAGLLIIGVQGALTPLIYTHYRDKSTPAVLEMVFRYFLLAALIVFLGLVFFAEDVFRYFIAPEYFGGVALTFYLIPAVLLNGMYVFAPGISLEKKTGLFLFINLIGGVLGFFLCYCLLPLLGLLGVGLASFLTALFVFSAFMFFSQLYYPVPHVWSRLLIISLIAFTFAWIVPRAGLSHFERWALSVCLLGAFGCLAVFLGLVRENDFKQFSLWRNH